MTSFVKLGISVGGVPDFARTWVHREYQTDAGWFGIHSLSEWHLAVRFLELMQKMINHEGSKRRREFFIAPRCHEVDRDQQGTKRGSMIMVFYEGFDYVADSLFLGGSHWHDFAWAFHCDHLQAFIEPYAGYCGTVITEHGRGVGDE